MLLSPPVVNLQISRASPREKREEIDVELCILSGRNLRAADIGVLTKGKSDPYVTVYATRDHKDEKVGSTKVKSATLNPVWDPDCLKVTFALTDEHFQGLKLAVFDQDRLGFDDALGMVLLSKEELLEPRVRPLEKDLVPHPKSSPELQKKTTGSLRVRLHLAGKIGVFVDSAKHLHSADGVMGKSDPYAVVKWLGAKARKVTRTRTKDETLSPVWNHGFILPIPLLMPLHGGKLEVSVWDDDFFGSDLLYRGELGF